jgi:hypothetical protein
VGAGCAHYLSSRKFISSDSGVPSSDWMRELHVDWLVRQPTHFWSSDNLMLYVRKVHDDSEANIYPLTTVITDEAMCTLVILDP